MLSITTVYFHEAQRMTWHILLLLFPQNVLSHWRFFIFSLYLSFHSLQFIIGPLFLSPVLKLLSLLWSNGFSIFSSLHSSALTFSLLSTEHSSSIKITPKLPFFSFEKFHSPSLQFGTLMISTLSIFSSKISANILQNCRNKATTRRRIWVDLFRCPRVKDLYREKQQHRCRVVFSIQ
jgi:hypothetical protein